MDPETRRKIDYLPTSPTLHPHIEEGRKRYRDGCRCPTCKAAWAEYNRVRRRTLEPELLTGLLEDTETEIRSLRAQLGQTRRQRDRAIEDKQAVERELERREARANRILFEASKDLITDGFDPHGFFVYFLLDDAGAPLYIGQSENVLARLGQHMGEVGKRSKVSSIALIRFDSHAAMLSAESRFIGEYCPPLNTVGVRP